MPALTEPPGAALTEGGAAFGAPDAANGGKRREPDLPEHEDIILNSPVLRTEFAFDEADPSVEEAALKRRMAQLARQASLDPDNGVKL